MNVCVLLVGQPRSFELASIGLRQVFETNLRPGDRLCYFPVFWNYQCSWWGRTSIQILDDSILLRQIEKAYSVEKLISPTIISFEEADNYLGGLGITKESYLNSTQNYVDWWKFRTLHQVWLPKRAVELFETYNANTKSQWDLVFLIRPDLVFWGNKIDYNAIEENMRTLKKAKDCYIRDVCSYRWLFTGFSEISNAKPLKVKDLLESPQEKPNIGDRFAVGTTWSIVQFFKTVWKMYLEHLQLSFDDPDALTLYPEELWLQALTYLHSPMLDILSPVELQHDVLRSFLLKYPEVKRILEFEQFEVFHEDYNREMAENRKKEIFCFMTEQDYIDFRKIKGYEDSRFV